MEFGCSVLWEEQTKNERGFASPGFSILINLLLSEIIKSVLFANIFRAQGYSLALCSSWAALHVI